MPSASEICTGRGGVPGRGGCGVRWLTLLAAVLRAVALPLAVFLRLGFGGGGIRCFFYYTILAVLGIIILRWLGALAAPGKRLSRGGRRSEAAL